MIIILYIISFYIFIIFYNDINTPLPPSSFSLFPSTPPYLYFPEFTNKFIFCAPVNIFSSLLCFPLLSVPSPARPAGFLATFSLPCSPVVTHVRLIYKIYSDYCWIKLNLNCNYPFPIDLVLNEILFGTKSIGEV